jgi:C1A family cysteine protease
MSEIIGKFGMGWLPDLPDFHDHTMNDSDVSSKMKKLGQKDSIKKMMSKTGVATRKNAPLPPRTDLRQWCSPVEKQGKLGSCTANAGVGIVEYFERRAFGKHIDASRLFLYKTTRNLLKQKGDTGAYLRTTMQAMVLFGVPPEEYWPYDVEDYDKEPSAFCYSFAQNYQAINYYRLDPVGIDPKTLLTSIKTNLAAGLPSMFGFTVYSSIIESEKNGGLIPFPASGDRSEGGHAVVAIGYDDDLKIKNKAPKAKETKGALLIRNSWGTDWGDNGYGWFPYEYVLQGLALDWWSLLKNEWINTGLFKL